MANIIFPIRIPLNSKNTGFPYDTDSTQKALKLIKSQRADLYEPLLDEAYRLQEQEYRGTVDEESYITLTLLLLKLANKNGLVVFVEGT